MTYYFYWGKAKPSDNGNSCHLLPYHSLDVAAVGWYLLAPDRPLAQRLSSELRLSPEALRRLFVFLLGLHDLGKFSRAFQGLAQLDIEGLVPAVPRYEYTVRHDSLGALLWQEQWFAWMDAGLLRWPDAELERKEVRQRRKTMVALLSPFFGHHGQPVEGAHADIGRFFAVDDISDDIAAAGKFVADWAELLEVVWPVGLMTSEAWLDAFLSVSWTIAGWVTLSDWLGSNQDYFTYQQQEMPLSEYWINQALPGAENVLKGTGFDQPAQPLPYEGLAAWFEGKSVTPTPLQQESETIALDTSPQLFILEDVTGAGKTEAACILAQRLLAAGEGEGIYFALPTMATSNAMYQRLGKLHRRFFTAESKPSFVLAHGASHLNESFTAAIDAAQPRDRNYIPDEATASAQCNHWLADSRKKALLAEVGVGTIDQALMGVLPFRHQSLRLLGLARKVLIVDEVHAYDAYMQTLLARLLTHHARQGGSAILLTATLPHAMRKSLSDAWSQGLGQAPINLERDDFPLLTRISASSLREVPLETRPEVVREVAVDWLTEEEQAIERVMEAVEQGECVAWVRSTVDDAIRAFEAVRERHPDPARCLLFHSRFAMLDRQRIETDVLERLGKASTPVQRRGQVLISTQVFQESLDCDVDLMISDIAPIDLIIQRAGRLQRHSRGPRRPPMLHVLAPAWAEEPGEKWLYDALPGTSFVYRDTSVCWLTQRILRELGAIRLPQQARELIEGVYGAVSELVPDGLQAARWEQKGMQGVAMSMATFNVLELESGYIWNRHQWQEEQEFGTRLIDEPTVRVALLTREGHGGLVLWAEGERHPDMLSLLSLRQSQARHLDELASKDSASWAALQERYPALRFVQPWVVGDAGGTYSLERGFELASSASRDA